MFRPSDILIDEFVKHLDQDYTVRFGDGVASHRDAIRQVAQMALPRIARSDALYHDLGYAFLITLVGQEILIGRMTRDGGRDVERLGPFRRLAAMLDGWVWSRFMSW